MRILYLPNEGNLNDNPGPRYAFTQLERKGELSALKIYSYLVRGKELGSAKRMWDEFAQVFREFKPDVVYIQHIANFPISTAVLKALKHEFPQTFFAYEDKDAFDRFYKKITPSMAALCALSDIIFVNGKSPEYFSLFSRFGCRDIYYISDFFYAQQFAGPDAPPKVDLSNCDVVMIASRTRPWFSRFPGLVHFQMEGSVEREQLARKLQKRFGSRFAIFGHGWQGFPCCRGTLPFSQQGNVIRKIPVNVIWDHENSIPLYSSNRLPISLGSGGIHVRSYIPGMEEFVPNGKAFFWEKSVDDLIARVEKVLEMPKEKRDEIIENGRALASELFDPVKIYSEVVSRIKSKKRL